MPRYEHGAKGKARGRSTSGRSTSDRDTSWTRPGLNCLLRTEHDT